LDIRQGTALVLSRGLKEKLERKLPLKIVKSEEQKKDGAIEGPVLRGISKGRDRT